MAPELLNFLNNAFVLASIVGLLKLAYVIVNMNFTIKELAKDIKNLQDFVYPKEIGSIKK